MNSLRLYVLLSRSLAQSSVPEQLLCLDGIYTPNIWICSCSCCYCCCFSLISEQVGCIPDFVSCSEPDPLRDRSVLLGLLGQDPLDLERLLRRLHTRNYVTCIAQKARRRVPTMQHTANFDKQHCGNASTQRFLPDLRHCIRAAHAIFSVNTRAWDGCVLPWCQVSAAADSLQQKELCCACCFVCQPVLQRRHPTR